MLRAILVSVDYWDYLSVTLPYNRHHFERVMVVTAPHDIKTRSLAFRYGCECHVTDAFYRDGADFAKWLALEEGLDVFGRHGWLCLMDCDVLWPKDARMTLARGCLATPYRRMYDGPLTKIPDESQWDRYPRHRNVAEHAGYTQVFHAEDPHLPRPPWHQTDWRHAGGADSFFQRLWPRERKIRPDFEVLHLGVSGVNWCGRSTPYADGSLPELAGERRIKTIGYQRGRKRCMEETGDPYKHERLT